MVHLDYEVAHLAALVAKERRAVRRDVDNLIDLCRSFAANGVIRDNDLRALDDLIRRKKRLKSAPLVDEICALTEKAVRYPGTSATRVQLYGAIRQLTGETRVDGQLESTTLPLTRPAPSVVFQGQSFCFTGTFECGERTDCEEVTVLLGGHACKAVSQRVNYLVIGATATDAWLHSSYGRKIQDAVHLNNHSAIPRIAIVAEAHWVDAVNAARPGTF
jgi:NAD-dependent DNA ligase